MALWTLRGARRGIVTTRFPSRPEPEAAGWPAPPLFRDDEIGLDLALQMAAVCPSSALEVAGERLRLDLGRCTACGRCLELAQQFGRRRPEALLATRHPGSLLMSYRLGDVR